MVVPEIKTNLAWEISPPLIMISLGTKLRQMSFLAMRAN